MNTEHSRQCFEKAKLLLPGGVSSPVRAFAPYPIFISRGKGSRLYDVDGNEYIDYCLGFGPLILGHAPEEVVKALQIQAELGTLYGAPIEMEARMAEMISHYYPNVEMLRFVSSGTEATMHALRLARGYTQRKKIVKIEGGFHGAHDAVLVRAGSGATTHSAPDSLGVLEEVASQTLLAPYNDLEAVRQLLVTNREEVAAVILEPVLGNIGPVLPEKGYLQGLRELCTEHGALLIFDEVITGFRLALGGAQELFGVRADITTLGKILGGGMPIGAFGASKEIMSFISPLGKVYQAGTFSGNPMSLTAGYHTIKALAREGHEHLNARGEEMRAGLARVCRELGLEFQVQGIGSMFQLFLTRHEVRDYRSALTCDGERFMRLFRFLLDHGIYLPPSQWETCFLCTAHSSADVRRTVEAYASSLQEVR
ncbi:MAG: glutamate-1-semialdehyde 2,1-aminomutase [Methanomassiliicoccales archaeon]